MSDYDYDYDEMYAAEDPDDSPPWEIGRPQPILENEFASVSALGSVLDAGCGTGDLALCLAGRAKKVLGFDVSTVAIDKARTKAAERGVGNVEFVAADATNLQAMDGGYDLITDSGLLHSLDDTSQGTYLTGLRQLATPAARLVILAGSLEADQGWGFDRSTLATVVGDHGWRVESLEDVEMYAEMGKQEFHLPAFLVRAGVSD